MFSIWPKAQLHFITIRFVCEPMGFLGSSSNCLHKEKYVSISSVVELIQALMTTNLARNTQLHKNNWWCNSTSC